MSQNYQFQSMIPFTPVVKKLVIINVAIWVIFVLILQQFVFKQNYIYDWFALTPIKIVNDFWLWQPFTYIFLHSTNVFHVAFNMMLIWMFGAELEARWGSRFFLAYYLVSGIGAALIYVIGLLVYYFVTNQFGPLQIPVVGASGAVFGLLLAYGLNFGERMIFFMMLFPMKARYFVLIIGAMELATLMTSGVGSGVANLCHLGGIAAGYLFLKFWNKWQGIRLRSGTKKHGRKLRLVVDNDRKLENNDDQGPRFWN